MRGVRVNVLDVTVRSSLIFLQLRRHRMLVVCHPVCLLATPGIQESVFLVEIQCPKNVIGNVYSVSNKRRGQVFTEEQRIGKADVHYESVSPCRGFVCASRVDRCSRSLCPIAGSS